MFAEEWPLLVFTLLTQLAIGTFLMLILVRGLLASQDTQLAMKVVMPGITIAAPVMALALLLSLSHLGSPFGGDPVLCRGERGCRVQPGVPGRCASILCRHVPVHCMRRLVAGAAIPFA